MLILPRTRRKREVHAPGCPFMLILVGCLNIFIHWGYVITTLPSKEMILPQGKKVANIY
jgi:hypothetical protein